MTGYLVQPHEHLWAHWHSSDSWAHTLLRHTCGGGSLLKKSRRPPKKPKRPCTHLYNTAAAPQLASPAPCLTGGKRRARAQAPAAASGRFPAEFSWMEKLQTEGKRVSADNEHFILGCGQVICFSEEGFFLLYLVGLLGQPR